MTAMQARKLTTALRVAFFVFSALALIAGIQLFVMSGHTDEFFSWTIEPPLTAAFLGALYWAALVLILWAATRETWAEARPTAYPVLVIAVLLLIATIVHIDRFHLDSLFGWFWVVVYAAVCPLLLILYALQLREPGADLKGSRSLPLPLRLALGAEAAALLGAGAVLFLAPGTAADLWPWTLTPLTSRAMGAFVLGIGVTAAIAVRENDLDSFRGGAYAYTVLGALELLAAAIHSGDFGDDGLATGVYLACLAAILLTGLYGSLAFRPSGSASRAARASARS